MKLVALYVNLQPQIFLLLITEKTITATQSPAFSARLKDYGLLTKLRLSSLVVFSAAIGYVIGTRGDFVFSQLCWLILGGFLVTGSSNAFNQIIERDLDKLAAVHSPRMVLAVAD